MNGKRQTRLKALLARLSPGLSRTTAVLRRPLLSETELQQLQQAALAAVPLQIETDVQQMLLGERRSNFAGSGYEFAEHRRYVAGDDIRFINWRAMARTGKLYRKVFHEERRPQCYLVVDRRAPMRFGTRQQLKVTCAVRQAITLLYQAQQQQLFTGGVILEDQAVWLKPVQGSKSLHTLIQQFNRPCPPLPFEQTQLALDAVLAELAVRLSAGCLIYILSDFHDLSTSSVATLCLLAQQHTLHAVQILDPAEQTLPALPHYRLYDEQSHRPLEINGADTLLQRQFSQAMQERQAHITELIEQAGGHYHLQLTDDTRDG